MSQDFEKRTREVLAESVERLDGRTRSRLTQARHAALALAGKPRAANWLRTFVPAGAAAAVAVLAVVMWTGQTQTDAVLALAAPVDDMDFLADAEAPDFLDDTDELEFYEWAAGEIES